MLLLVIKVVWYNIGKVPSNVLLKSIYQLVNGWEKVVCSHNIKGRFILSFNKDNENMINKLINAFIITIL